MVMESRGKLARKISSKAKLTTGEAILRESNAMYENTPKQSKRTANKKSKKPTSHDTQKVKKPKTPIVKEKGKGEKAKKKFMSKKVHTVHQMLKSAIFNSHRFNQPGWLSLQQDSWQFEFATITNTHMNCQESLANSLSYRFYLQFESKVYCSLRVFSILDL